MQLASARNSRHVTTPNKRKSKIKKPSPGAEFLIENEDPDTPLRLLFLVCTVLEIGGLSVR